MIIIMIIIQVYYDLLKVLFISLDIEEHANKTSNGMNIGCRSNSLGNVATFIKKYYIF